MTRIGLIARSDERGLGHITREFFRHLSPAKTLVVEPRPSSHPFHPDWYRATDGRKVATVRLESSHAFPEREMRRWLDGLDVVYTAETFYDWRSLAWAREGGVATVIHANPEFFVPRYFAGVPPTALWNQSPWRHDTLGDATVVPVPVAADRFTRRPDPNHDGPLRVLHVSGSNASGDRNGTETFLAAMQKVSAPIESVTFTQARRHPLRSLGRFEQPRGDYWTMYDGFDVLVMPRRYGGQCLPVQEAMAAGLAVVMTDCPPNDWWPMIRVPAQRNGTHSTPAGLVDLWDADEAAIADVVTELAVDRDRLAAAQAASWSWAQANSWQALSPMYLDRLAAVAGQL